MKKNYALIMLLIATASVFYTCRKDEVSNSENLININLKKSISEFSEPEKIAYLEARNRMDKNIEFKEDQYLLKTNNPIEIGVSKETFEYFKRIMNGMNSTLKAIEKTSTTIIVQKDKSLIFLKNTYSSNNGKKLNLSATTQERRVNLFMYVPDVSNVADGGVNKLVSYWWGQEIYVSYTALNDIAAGATIAGALSLAIPDVTVTKAVCIVLGVVGGTTWMIANHYPNGVIVTVVNPIITPPIPTDLRSQ